MLIALPGAAGFLIFWELGRNALAVGVAAGAGLGLIELESTVLILPRLAAGPSRALWGSLLAGKSLLVFTALGILLLGLKINPFGFIIGFSEAVLVTILTAAWLGTGPGRDKTKDA